MAQVAELVAKLRLDSSDFQRGMQQAQSSASRAGGQMRRAGMVMSAGVTLPLAAAGVAAVRWASDAEEARNKVRVVFGDQANIVERWAEDAAESMGMSSAAALDAAGTFGNFFDGMGLAAGPAREMSTSLVQLAGDLASFNNADPSEMLAALRAGMAGETEPLRRFGVNMTEASLSAFAMEQGITQSVSSMTDAQKAQLRYSFILDRTRNAQGDFARTSDGTANSMRTLWGQVQDLGAAFGAVLLPAVTSAMNWLKGLLDRVLNMSEGSRTFVLVLAGVAAAIGPVTWAIGGLLGVIGALSLPVLAVVAAIALLVGGFVLAYQRSEKFREVVQKVVEWFKTSFAPAMVEAFQRVVEWVKGPFAEGVVDAIDGVISWWEQNWPAIRDTVVAVLGYIEQFWNTWGGTIVGFVTRHFNAVKQTIQGVLNFIAGIVRTVMAIVRGDWSGAWEGIKQAVAGVWQAIQGIVRMTLNQIRTVLEVAWRAVAGIFDGIWNGIVSAFRGYWNLLKTAATTQVNAIKAVVLAVWNALKAATTAVWNAIKGAVTAVWNAIKTGVTSSVNRVKTTVTTVWTGIKTATSTIWSGIKSAVQGAINGVVGFFTGLPGRIRNTITNIAAAALAVGQAVIRGLGRGLSAVASFAGDIASAVRSALIGAINGVIDLLNGAIPNSIPGPGPLPDIDLPDNPIPHVAGRAKGGPVVGGTPYLVGEKGPELFMPAGSGKVVPNNRLGAGGAMAPLDPNGELKKLAKQVKATSKDVDKTWGKSMTDFADKTTTGHLASAEAAKKGLADQTASVTTGGANIKRSWSQTMNTVTTSTRTGWTNARTSTNTGMTNIAERVRTGAASAVSAMRTGATNLHSAWRSGLNDTRQTTWTILAGGSPSVKSKTAEAVTAIGRTWDGVKGEFRRPLQAVVTDVVNRFLGGLRPIARTVGLGDSVPANMPRFHSGGVVGGAGEVLAVLQSGEVVLDRATVRALSGERGGTRRGDRIGDGPGVGALPGLLGQIASRAGSYRGDYDVVQRMLTTMEATMRRAAAFSAQKLSGRIGDGLAQPMAEAVIRAIPALRDAFVPPVYPGMGWEKMWEIVHRQFPWAQLFSAMRYGAAAITATGNPSYHGKGRAIDITPSLEIFNWLHDNFMRQTTELIFSIPEAAARNIWHGQHHPYSEPTFSDHFDHIHWAVAKGMDAVVSRPTSFLAGEAGAERVTVRPYNGPGSGAPADGVVNHFHIAGFIDRDTVDEITRSQEWSRRKARL